ncbi:acid protease [Annulohypoxylon maeteangense]|uniref:acid protease n=1 Tax=Annulohypoxylon maeteangense TaxID=1927788 RepID=UPI0020079254|nr:acid protease [Annulohypoxylon maeteangense]KAI0880263.1 acid protease [Annulohypoxylon maeteangense]
MLELPRHRYMTTLLLIIGIATSVLASNTCAPNPIAVRIGNVTLTNHQVARGAEIHVGSPPQPFAFLPQWPYNTSLVYGTDGHCVFKRNTPTNDGCATLRGGAYDIFASKTRLVAYPGDFPKENAPFPQTTLFADGVKLNENTTLTGFPLGVALNDWGAEGYHPMASLGLGTNSTFLNTLQESGKIASRTWSFFWGRSSGPSSSQTDGSLVFGGYDRAKISSGERYVEKLQDSTSPCATQMIVIITDMVLNFPNGTDVSIFPRSLSTALTACIVPDYPVLMTLPSDPFMDNFFQLTDAAQNHGRSFGINYYSFQYNRNEERYSGDMTIKFQSGLTVRVANDQLVAPDVDINPTTGELVANYTNPDLVINGLQNISSNDMPQLGRQFLSAAYLMVNQDARKFSLWPANPVSGEDLVPVDVNNIDITTICQSNASATTNSNSTIANTELEASRSSPGTIAGAVVGSIGGVIILGIVAFGLIKKRREKSSKTGDQNQFTQAYIDTEYYHHVTPGSKPELEDSSFLRPVELEHPTQRDLPPYELGG